MASKTKIFIVLELVHGGELFDKIVRHCFPDYNFSFSQASFSIESLSGHKSVALIFEVFQFAV